MFLNNINVSDFITVDFSGINTTTTQQFTFPDIPYLRNRKVYAIALNTSPYGVDSGLSNVGFGLAFNTIANSSSFLTLYDKNGDQFIQDLPLQELICNRAFFTNTAPDRIQFQTKFQTNGLTVFTPRIIQWTKCSIYFPVALGVGNVSFQFDIFYKYNN
jgi:hypothetical protein